ncbi:MAG: MarR family transcriptional regulator [Eubacterium sp.]|jgi:DNA-binding MarR family transcriptional regulator|nr:MarR family transcriptional regulator [Eubacterium sp.]
MDTIGKLNAAIYRCMQGIINFKLRDIPIGSGQHDFFYVISKSEGLTQKELGQHLYVGKSTTTKAVQNLILNGYIRKEKDEKDKRCDRLYLTEEGKRILPRIHATFSEAVELTTKNLSPQETELALDLLKRILQNVSYEKIKLSAESNENM